MGEMRRLDDESKRQIEAGLRQSAEVVPTAQTIEEILKEQERFEEAKAEFLAFVNSFQTDEVYSYLYTLYKATEPIDSEDSWLRGQAFEALSQLPGRDPALFLSEIVHHEDPGWRWAACSRIGALGGLATPACINLLCSSLLNDQDADVRFCAAGALGEVGDKSALPALRHAETNDKGEDYEGRPISETAKKAIEAILART